MNNYRESKIPSTAKRVFTGKIFDVYQWEQKMFDETIQTFEKLTRPDTASVIAVTTEGKILITEQEQPGTSQCLCMPGGRVDTGETPLITAQRELLEETGYGGGYWEQFLAISRYSKIDYCFYVFVARGVSKQSDPRLDPGEKIVVKQVTFDDYMNILAEQQFEDNDLALHILRLQKDSARFNDFRKLLGT